MWLKCTLVCLQLLTFCWAVFKPADDSALYKIQWKSHSAMPEHLLSAEEDLMSDQPILHVSSGDDEKYLCTIPVESSQSQKKVESYSGPSPGELLKALYTSRLCSYWLDVYWTYELCHGRYLLQYHEEKEFVKKGRSEFYLGNYQREQSKLDDAKFDQLNPPKRKISNKAVPYYPVNYRQGTVCDLTGKPRRTVVIYICKPDANDQIHSFTEVASCVYEMVILTRLLCSHPAFQPATAVESDIVCYAKDEHQKDPKPKKLLEMEDEKKGAVEKVSEKMMFLKPPRIRKRRGIRFHKYIKESWTIENRSNFALEEEYSASSAVARKEIDEEIEEEGDDDSETTVITPKLGPPSSLVEEKVVPTTSKPTFDMSILIEENRYLLSGKQCLYGGGSGWWKYEFCYGKSVIQFHDSAPEQRVEILLGLFNEEIHKHWIDDNPHKRPLKIDGQVAQVSHLYSGGEYCEEAEVHRSVEVRVRCRDSAGSPTAVTLYLLEPHTCNYILAVESPRFCDLLQTVDEYGLIKLPKSHRNEL